MSISLAVEGKYACFSRPEFKVERTSYDVMTPSAARGLLEAIYWHPGVAWRIDRIRVCSPIRFCSVRRNELASKIHAKTAKTVMTRGGGPLYLDRTKDIQQRASLLLRDVSYIVDAHFDLTEKAAATDNPGKIQDIITRRIRKGQCFHQPYFGCREFPAEFREFIGDFTCPKELLGDIDLGWMLYDMDYSEPGNIRPRFFRGRLCNGVMEIPAWNSEEVRG